MLPAAKQLNFDTSSIKHVSRWAIANWEGSAEDVHVLSDKSSYAEKSSRIVWGGLSSNNGDKPGNRRETDQYSAGKTVYR
jgi:hypothetical protein